MHYYDENKRTAILVTIDQEKAFDRTNHILFFKMLEKFNFGPTIVNMVKSIYEKMTSRLLIKWIYHRMFRRYQKCSPGGWAVNDSLCISGRASLSDVAKQSGNSSNPTSQL